MGESEADEQKVEMRRELGVVELTCMGVGGIVGAGIFVISGQAAAAYAGPAIVLSFALAGSCCIVYALCFAELAAMVPISGSAYTYTRVAFGRFPGFLIGWALIVEYLFAAAAVAVGWSGYVRSLFRSINLPIPESIDDAPFEFGEDHGLRSTGAIVNLPAVLLIAIATIIVGVGAKTSSLATTIAVVIKISVILIFTVAGSFFVDPENWEPFIPESPDGEFGHFGWSGVIRASSVIFFAYIGFDAVTTAAAESRDPSSDLPTAIFWSLGISTALYMGTSLVMTGLASYTLLGVPDPMAVAVQNAGPGLSWLAPFITVAVIVGVLGVVFVSMFAISRVLHTMASDGMLPELFAELHPTFCTPLYSTLVCGVVAGLIAGLFPIGVIAELVSVGTLFAFGMVCAGVVVLRHSQPDAHRPVVVPFSPVVPGIGVLLAAGQILFLPWTAWVRMALWMAGGLILWFFYGSKGSDKEDMYERVQ